jgi:hypothetical protein
MGEAIMPAMFRFCAYVALLVLLVVPASRTARAGWWEIDVAETAAAALAETPTGRQALASFAKSRVGQAVLAEFYGVLGRNAAPLEQQGERLLTNPKMFESLIGKLPPEKRENMFASLNTLALSRPAAQPLPLAPDAPLMLCQRVGGCTVTFAKSVAKSAAVGTSAAVIGTPITMGAKRLCEDYDCDARVAKQIELLLKSADPNLAPPAKSP